MPRLSLVVAIAENYAIGRDNDLLCHLPADLKHFKALTTGHSIIMGRRTFESLPAGPLPMRCNIVLSRSLKSGEAYRCVTSLDEALRLCAAEEEVFIIGGESVYRHVLPRVDRMYITWIQARFDDADTFFPQVNFDEWEEVSREDFDADAKNPYPYSFVEYRRKHNETNN